MQKVCKNEAGISMLEISIFLPLIVFLGLGILELTHVLSRYQTVSSMSREAANMLYRDCRIASNSTTTYEAGELCLTTAFNDMQEQMDVILPGAKLIMTLYQNNCGAVNSRCYLTMSNDVVTSTPQKVNEAYIQANYDNSSNAGKNFFEQSEQNTIAVSEVILPGSGWIFSGIFGGELYEATVY